MMKKWIVFALCIALALSLCACNVANNPDDGGETSSQSQLTDKEKAISCIDKDVAELYDLIGQPQSSDYAPSCLGEGGEDGNLYYADFTVYTYRQGDTEVVKDVE